LSIDEQASEVDRVKRSESGMIVDPITLSPTHRIYEALELMKTICPGPTRNMGSSACVKR